MHEVSDQDIFISKRNGKPPANFFAIMKSQLFSLAMMACLPGTSFGFGINSSIGGGRVTFVSKPLFLSDGSENSIKRIGKEEMEEILEEYEECGRIESGFIVLDVRGPDEVASTGKLSASIETVPVQLMAQVSLLLLGVS